MTGREDESSVNSAKPTPKSTGRRGEETAARYLEHQGYTVLERNYRADRYEIDIIVRRENMVVFCEVKTARTKRFGEPVEWVTPRKIARIANAAREYIHERDLRDVSYRFDVIGLDASDHDRVAVNHIENAFFVPGEDD